MRKHISNTLYDLLSVESMNIVSYIEYSISRISAFTHLTGHENKKSKLNIAFLFHTSSVFGFVKLISYTIHNIFFLHLDQSTLSILISNFFNLLILCLSL